MRVLPCFLALGLISAPASLMFAASSDRPAPVKSEWFTADEVAPNTWRIVENATVNVYLVIGRDRALLIDTGYGRANLRRYVQSLTSLPLTVINTHGHGDHAGGNPQFGTALMHPADAADMAPMFASMQGARKPDPKVPAAEQFDYDTDSKPVAFQPVKDGQVLDLGDREIEIIETPGHTAGEIVLLDRAHKLLFAGDHINRLVWLQLPNCLPLEIYLTSLEKIAAREAEFTTIMPGHNEPFDRGVLKEKIVCVKGILAGTISDEAYTYGASYAHGRIAKFERSSVVFNPQNLRVKR